MKALLIVLYGVTAVFGTPSWRIIGGHKASEGQFPHQVSLRRSYFTHICGGSILDETTILSAAHCVDGTTAQALQVVVGTNSLIFGGDRYKVKKITVHPKWNKWSMKNDVSILKLESAITFKKKVKPVQLRRSNVGADEDVVLSGWGSTRTGGSSSISLQWIRLMTLGVEDCRKMQPNGLVSDSQVCTFTKEGEGACHGDSGGPLVDDKGEQIGIVSWGTPCARGYPDVFTRVYCFLNWIDENKS